MQVKKGRIGKKSPATGSKKDATVAKKVKYNDVYGKRETSDSN